MFASNPVLRYSSFLTLKVQNTTHVPGDVVEYDCVMDQLEFEEIEEEIEEGNEEEIEEGNEEEIEEEIAARPKAIVSGKRKAEQDPRRRTSKRLAE